MSLERQTIKILQEQRDAANARIEAMLTEIIAFRAHLASDKFAGFDSNGDRKDWINVRDVDARLIAIRYAGLE
jgi:hypothetical protein